MKLLLHRAGCLLLASCLVFDPAWTQAAGGLRAVSVPASIGKASGFWSVQAIIEPTVSERVLPKASAGIIRSISRKTRWVAAGLLAVALMQGQTRSPSDRLDRVRTEPRAVSFFDLPQLKTEYEDLLKTGAFHRDPRVEAMLREQAKTPVATQAMVDAVRQEPAIANQVIDLFLYSPEAREKAAWVLIRAGLLDRYLAFVKEFSVRGALEAPAPVDTYQEWVHIQFLTAHCDHPSETTAEILRDHLIDDLPVDLFHRMVTIVHAQIPHRDAVIVPGEAVMAPTIGALADVIRGPRSEGWRFVAPLAAYGEAAIPHLLPLVDDDSYNGDAQLAVVRALGNNGDPRALPRLYGLRSPLHWWFSWSEPHDDKVRQAVDRAIRKIEANTKPADLAAWRSKPTSYGQTWARLFLAQFAAGAALLMGFSLLVSLGIGLLSMLRLSSRRLPVLRMARELLWVAPARAHPFNRFLAYVAALALELTVLAIPLSFSMITGSAAILGWSLLWIAGMVAVNYYVPRQPAEGVLLVARVAVFPLSYLGQAWSYFRSASLTSEQFVDMRRLRMRRDENPAWWIAPLQNHTDNPLPEMLTPEQLAMMQRGGRDLFQKLIRDVFHPDPAEMIYAAHVLSFWPSAVDAQTVTEIVQTLTQAMEKADPERQAAVLLALQRLPLTFDQWARVWSIGLTQDSSERWSKQYDGESMNDFIWTRFRNAKNGIGVIPYLSLCGLGAWPWATVPTGYASREAWEATVTPDGLALARDHLLGAAKKEQYFDDAVKGIEHLFPYDKGIQTDVWILGLTRQNRTPALAALAALQDPRAVAPLTALLLKVDKENAPSVMKALDSFSLTAPEWVDIVVKAQNNLGIWTWAFTHLDYSDEAGARDRMLSVVAAKSGKSLSDEQAVQVVAYFQRGLEQGLAGHDTFVAVTAACEKALAFRGVGYARAFAACARAGVARNLMTKADLARDVLASRPSFSNFIALCTTFPEWVTPALRRLFKLIGEDIQRAAPENRDALTTQIGQSIDRYVASRQSTVEAEATVISNWAAIVHSNLPLCLDSVRAMSMSLEELEPLRRVLAVNNPLTTIVRTMAGNETAGLPRFIAADFGQRQHFLTLVVEICKSKQDAAPIEVSGILDLLQGMEIADRPTTPEQWTAFGENVQDYYRRGFKVLTPKFFNYFVQHRDQPQTLVDFNAAMRRELTGRGLGSYFGLTPEFRARFDLSDEDEVSLLSFFARATNLSGREYTKAYFTVKAELDKITPAAWQAEVPSRIRQVYTVHGTRALILYNPADSTVRTQRDRLVERIGSWMDGPRRPTTAEDLFALLLGSPEAARAWCLTFAPSLRRDDPRRTLGAFPSAPDAQREWLSRWSTLIADELFHNQRDAMAKWVSDFWRPQLTSSRAAEPLLRRLGWTWQPMTEQRTMGSPLSAVGISHLTSENVPALSKAFQEMWLRTIPTFELESAVDFRAWVDRGMPDLLAHLNAARPGHPISPQEEIVLRRALKNAREESLKGKPEIAARNQLVAATLERMEELFREPLTEMAIQLKAYQEQSEPTDEVFTAGFYDDLLHLVGEFMVSEVCTWNDRFRQVRDGHKEGYHFGTLAAQNQTNRPFIVSQVQLLTTPVAGMSNAGHGKYPVLALTGINSVIKDLPMDQRRAVCTLLQTAKEIQREAHLQAAVLVEEPVIYSNQNPTHVVIQQLVAEGYLTPATLIAPVQLSRTPSTPYQYQRVLVINDIPGIHLTHSTLEAVEAHQDLQDKTLEKLNRPFLEGLGHILHNGELSPRGAEALQTRLEGILESIPSSIVDRFRADLLSQELALSVQVNLTLDHSRVDRSIGHLTVYIGRDIHYGETGFEVLGLQQLISEALASTRVMSYDALKKAGASNENAAMKLAVIQGLINYRQRHALYHRWTKGSAWGSADHWENLSPGERDRLTAQYQEALTRLNAGWRGIFQPSLFQNVLDDVDGNRTVFNYLEMISRDPRLNGPEQDEVLGQLIDQVAAAGVFQHVSLAHLRNAAKEFLFDGTVVIRDPETQKPVEKARFDRFDDSERLARWHQTLRTTDKVDVYYETLQQVLEYMLPLSPEAVRSELGLWITKNLMVEQTSRDEVLRPLMESVLRRHLGGAALQALTQHLSASRSGPIPFIESINATLPEGDDADRAANRGYRTGEDRVPDLFPIPAQGGEEEVSRLTWRELLAGLAGTTATVRFLSSGAWSHAGFGFLLAVVIHEFVGHGLAAWIKGYPALPSVDGKGITWRYRTANGWRPLHDADVRVAGPLVSAVTTSLLVAALAISGSVSSPLLLAGMAASLVFSLADRNSSEASRGMRWTRPWAILALLLAAIPSFAQTPPSLSAEDRAVIDRLYHFETHAAAEQELLKRGFEGLKPLFESIDELRHYRSVLQDYDLREFLPIMDQLADLPGHTDDLQRMFIARKGDRFVGRLLLRKGPEGRALLLADVDHSDPDVAWSAIERLGESEPTSPELVARLLRPDILKNRNLRYAAFNVLAKVKPPLVGTFMRFLATPAALDSDPDHTLDQEMRGTIIRMLDSMGQPAVPLLLEALRNADKITARDKSIDYLEGALLRINPAAYDRWIVERDKTDIHRIGGGILLFLGIVQFLQWLSRTLGHARRARAFRAALRRQA